MASPRLLLGEEILDSLIGYHLLSEDIGASLGRPNHLDHLGEAFALTFLESCDNFLCHSFLLLFNLTMKSYLTQEGVVLHALQTIRSVLAVLGGDVARHTRDAASFLLGALENYLHTITLCFLSHCLGLFLFVQETFLLCTTEGGLEAYLVDKTEACAGDLEGHPTVFLGNVQLLLSDVGKETTLGPPLRMGNIVSILIVDARYLTNFRHCLLIL